MKALGLKMIPLDESISANTLSAPYYPESVNGGELLSYIGKEGIVVAGGLLADIKTAYFRVGHMGSVNHNDLIATVSAIEAGLSQCKFSFEKGSGLKALYDNF